MSIERLIDTTFLGWVQCAFVDASGSRHVLHEKIPVVATSAVALDTLPDAGAIRCTVINQNNAVVAIETLSPDGIESVAGEHRFFVEQALVTVCRS